MTAVDAGTRPATPAPASAPDIAEESSAFAPGAFGARHIGIDSEARATMLGVLGHDSIPSLLAKAVPETIQVDRFRTEGDSVLPEAATERDALAQLRRIASRNRVRTSMIGLGYHDTITPAVITRNVLENPSWYTAYTPYQPEISQGRLEALINFQTMVAELSGLATANASMLDEATAVVEGMLLARRASKAKTPVFLIDADALPQTRALLDSRAAAVGIELVAHDLATVDPAELPDAFGAFIQYPAASGRVWDPSAVIARVHAAGGLAVVAADLLALTVITSPGELGADIAVGTSQRFGVPMGFGGPHAGYLAVRAGLERQMPGRLVGVSQDAAGHPAYRLSLQTREQHIRREKATSNICTAQVLLAVMASMYAVYHGPKGLRVIARQANRGARRLVRSLATVGIEPVHAAFFDTVRVSVPGRADEILAAAAAGGVNLLRVDADTLGFSVDEATRPEDLAAVARAFGAELAEDEGAAGDLSSIPSGSIRTSEYLTHAVFSTHRSETGMMRYLKRLSDKDYALDRGMIPLGSCTMKLNAATEMEAVTWPEFQAIHPFAPADDVEGYLELVLQLETWLADVTGYDTVSLQPNAGSQGELAGLLAIRGYHLANGDDARTVCLIPQSAHGTNAASAGLAGMRVVVVACDDLGNVDLDDLRAKIAANRDELAGLMITYPSTHGVYEHEVGAICQAVHEAGGQVYVDGANLNALLGFARFGDFGGDVSHLNLHKTFCIPHGGGGPGVGPVAAKAHLAPFLPGHPQAQRNVHALVQDGVVSTIEHGGAPVSAAPYGSPSILPISWAYVRMMGAEGLKQATGAAVLSANYIAARLRDHYPVLYAGEDGLVAHECILDLRPLTAATGITVDDVAKRLVDYGFHAPTMSFPVPGTLMVEPTESEDLAEVERFIAAMIGIKQEADSVAAGEWPADDNPLRNAPHTAESVIAGEWTHAYTRERAVYPVSTLVRDKYWPPVRRIDQAYGDRNLFCACPPPEAFA
ncbi:aminomethyl-transferring glycine dehydrogenase [Clavibacter nebraskensis]|uniref:Glycine dehydrogenase (decarboxylating) n=2 Tax=Clavibacter nebraskensis TaxID=31963 RepID=A0A399QFP0_9MICO|nr:aminomethyl-transferring glycine dehydrogenase [Clavibacter nebraskensis]KXU20124.1 glycine dehydrogenase (aminomethyl-transferring) [Clavibacter nebraskensis]OAH20319.1 glycine dehydrogenase (aminomethyl-transferring) [Clavibacter nebraskensis]QGV67268.1 aminomethyl-transferring glycine dehydrogenase [Clavibacter nebraskensis]QGV70065.1 aminomethyl-transferring glycine dehydrogenase [Clavibacter nebraskensis]RIJ17630.1 glycine dehydrogenase (aminomethyl-transferring) [Clavibacter nebrasken